MVDMSNNLLNQTRFAELARVTRQAISKLIKNGGLVIRKDGKMDINNPVNSGYLKIKNSAPVKTEPKKVGIKKSPGYKTKSKSKKKKQIEDDEEPDLPENLNDCDIHQLTRHVKIEDILKKKQDRILKRNGLIDQKLVTPIFSKIYEILMNEFLTSKDKLAPDVASIFNSTDPKLINKTSEKLDSQSWKTLLNIKKQINTMLEKIECEDI